MRMMKKIYTRRVGQMKKKMDWLDLPWDIMIIIMLKIGVVDVVFNVQKVCRMWREASKEPILFRSLNFQGIDKYFTTRMEDSYVKFVKKAVDASARRLLHISLNEPFVLRHIVNHLIVTGSLQHLKSFKLGPRKYITEMCLSNICKHLPLLEEFDVCFGDFPMSVIQQLGQNSPKLTTFRLDKWICSLSFYDEVEAITENMPHLRSLTLTTSFLTNRGLEALLHGCPNLEYLDLRECSAAKVTKRMRNKCKSRLRKCWFPHKSSWARVRELVENEPWYPG